MVAAGFQSDVERRAPGLRPGLLERGDFRMITACDSMEAGPHDPAATHQHSADDRIGAGPSRCPSGQAARRSDIFEIVCAPV
jgi:hypothetical protein